MENCAVQQFSEVSLQARISENRKEQIYNIHLLVGLRCLSDKSFESDTTARQSSLCARIISTARSSSARTCAAHLATRSHGPDRETVFHFRCTSFQCIDLILTHFSNLNWRSQGLQASKSHPLDFVRLQCSCCPQKRNNCSGCVLFTMTKKNTFL